MGDTVAITRRSLFGAGAGLALGSSQPAWAAVPRARGAVLPVIMIDPGHGGRDPGAIGVTGTYEKDVALATAQQLRGLLNATGRFQAVLTRTQDTFIPLADRVAIAQGRNAALFVSVHADALSDRTVRGASVYTMADTASDAQAAALARRENGADRFGGPRFADQPPEVARILSSLVRQETRMGSARLSRSMVGALDGSIPVLPNPGRHAAFMVLRAADVPSVLVEMGFMSNPLDEAALRRADHRTRVARAMVRAVDGWFAANRAESGLRVG